MAKKNTRVKKAGFLEAFFSLPKYLQYSLLLWCGLNAVLVPRLTDFQANVHAAVSISFALFFGLVYMAYSLWRRRKEPSDAIRHTSETVASKVQVEPEH